MSLRNSILALTAFLFPTLAAASGSEPMDLTGAGVGLFSLALFGIAYLLVMAEEFTHLRKSKPVLLLPVY